MLKYAKMKYGILAEKKDFESLDSILSLGLNIPGITAYKKWPHIFNHNAIRLTIHNLMIKHGISTEECLRKLKELGISYEAGIDFNDIHRRVNLLLIGVYEYNPDLWKDDIRSRIEKFNHEEKCVLNFYLNHIKLNRHLSEQDGIITVWGAGDYEEYEGSKALTLKCERLFNIKLGHGHKVVLRYETDYYGRGQQNFKLWTLTEILVKAGIGYYVADLSSGGGISINMKIPKIFYDYALTIGFYDIKDFEKIERQNVNNNFTWENVKLEKFDIENTEDQMKYENEGQKGNHINMVDIKVGILSTMKDIDIKNLFLIPDCIGTYIFITDSGEIYIGSSKHVKTRLRQHQARGMSIISVTVYLTGGIMDALTLEYWLIKKLDPSLNKNKELLINEEDIFRIK